MGVMMDTCKVTSKDGYFDGDIEKGEINVDLINNGVKFGSNYYKMRELQFEGGNNCDNLLISHEEKAISSVGLSSDDDLENVKLIVVDNKLLEERNNGDVEGKMVKEKSKPKAMSAKKYPKPPRPPRGLSLDSADQKLIRELHELARLKRARAERLKALKKMKESKTSSSKNQLFATLLTVLFCVVLLLQGISSRTGSAASINVSHLSSELAQHNLISLQHYPISSAVGVGGTGSDSPRIVEQVSGVDSTKEVTRTVGRVDC